MEIKDIGFTNIAGRNLQRGIQVETDGHRLPDILATPNMGLLTWQSELHVWFFDPGPYESI